MLQRDRHNLAYFSIKYCHCNSIEAPLAQLDCKVVGWNLTRVLEQDTSSSGKCPDMTEKIVDWDIVHQSFVSTAPTYMDCQAKVQGNYFFIVPANCWAVADPEVVQGVRLSPPPHFEAKLFHFLGIYLKSWVKPTKRTPLCKFEPPLKKSWIRPCWGFNIGTLTPVRFSVVFGGAKCRVVTIS